MGTRRLVRRGRYFEEFEVGQRFTHHWGRTLAAAESSLFSTWTMNANPLYFNEPYARRMGHPTCPVNPLLSLNVIFGLSVEDLSEQALAHLGYWNLRFASPVYPGDTLFSSSLVLDLRPSESKADRGIVHVATHGENQRGERVLEYERKILVRRRPAEGTHAFQ